MPLPRAMLLMLPMEPMVTMARGLLMPTTPMVLLPPMPMVLLLPMLVPMLLVLLPLAWTPSPRELTPSPRALMPLPRAMLPMLPMEPMVTMARGLLTPTMELMVLDLDMLLPFPSDPPPVLTPSPRD